MQHPKCKIRAASEESFGLRILIFSKFRLKIWILDFEILILSEFQNPKSKPPSVQHFFHRRCQRFASDRAVSSRDRPGSEMRRGDCQGAKLHSHQEIFWGEFALGFCLTQTAKFCFSLRRIRCCNRKLQIFKIQNPRPRGCLVFPKTRFQNPSGRLLARGATKILSTKMSELSELERGES